MNNYQTFNTKETSVALYLRCSASVQNYQLLNCKNQLDEMKQYSKKHHLEIVRTYMEVSNSGSARPALKKLLAEAKLKKFKTVLVLSPCKLSRSIREARDLWNEFSSMGISLKFINPPLEEMDEPNAVVTAACMEMLSPYKKLLKI